MEDNNLHSFTLENQKRLIMTKVFAVENFSPTLIMLTLEKNRLQIMGQNLKILSFSKNTGCINVEGEINSIKYLNGKKTLIKRLFK